MATLAHTLGGAARGRAVADRKAPAAGWIGAIAGNAPDWSELLVSPGAWGGAPGSAPAYLVYHRGITHSFVGAVIEIVVLTGLVGLILTWRTRADAGARPPWRWIAVCVAAAVASHLYLDSGLVRPASVPAVERALVLRGLGRDRRSILLGGAARRTGVGLPAPLGAGAPRTPGHEWGHHASALDAEGDRCGVGAPRRDGTHGGVRGRLDEALVRCRRAAA